MAFVPASSSAQPPYAVAGAPYDMNYLRRPSEPVILSHQQMMNHYIHHGLPLQPTQGYPFVVQNLPPGVPVLYAPDPSMYHQQMMAHPPVQHTMPTHCTLVEPRTQIIYRGVPNLMAPGQQVPKHFPPSVPGAMQQAGRTAKRPVNQLKERIHKQLELGIKRRDRNKRSEVFKKYAKNSNTIVKDQLSPALQELISDVKQRDVDEFFENADLNNDKSLDEEEFQEAVQRWSQAGRVNQWARSYPFAEMLADAFPISGEGDPLRAVANLSREEIDIAIECYCEKIKEHLPNYVESLKASFVSLDQRQPNQREYSPQTKFEVPEMNCGTIKDYYEGLTKRVGMCNLDFKKAMEQEHCYREGNNVKFLTTNYRINTTPKREWEIIVNQQPCDEKEMRGKRVIPKISELTKLDIAIRAKLREEEVIAVVLYTGPMFQVYNTILRRYPDKEYQIYFKGDNLFSTTIFTLVSAVHKISRVMVIPPGLKLYRGLGGNHNLPSSFHHRDENGCKGFADWGFMSTTANKATAVEFSGVKHKERPAPIVLEISFGAVDRGACIKDFSQYPSEVEYLYPPCSFLEQGAPEYLEMTDHGIIKVYPVKVNTNGKTLTLEEQLSQKKDTHISAFSYAVEEIRQRLDKMAEERKAEDRLVKDTSKDQTHSVAGFIKRIIGQCTEVLERHRAVLPQQYTEDRVFRNLVMEMLEVKAMAAAKFEEWLVNTSGSFILYRLNAPLRTAYRRYIAYLEHGIAKASPDGKKSQALDVCKVKGLLVESLEELNELKETRLMAAAASGMSRKDVQTLVMAGALVNAGRPDGVTPLWLAAQFGHVHVVDELLKQKADVNQRANDLASPVYIASQGGNPDCIKTLVDGKANVTLADRNGLTPLHQAAINLHLDCLQRLVECKADASAVDNQNRTALDVLGKNDVETQKLCLEFLQSATKKSGRRASVTAPLSSISVGSASGRLIISTGDISDADGFMALAEYAKTGADALFVMNYPAYVGIPEAEEDEQYAEKNPGQGYKFSAKAVFGNAKEPPEEYTRFLERYNGKVDEAGKELSPNDRMKCAMTDLAFWMAMKVWNEVDVEDRPRKGKLLFCIGGINQVNPFSPKAVKNEVLVYSPLVYAKANEPGTQGPLSTQEGNIYDFAGNTASIDWEQYSEVYMDFNGSMAFLDEKWQEKLLDIASKGKLKAVFVMGGVLAETAPITMPSIPGILNRFSSATMNQLYHPQHAADFFALLEQRQDVEVYTVTNNAVVDLVDKDKDGKPTMATHQNVTVFLRENRLGGRFLQDLAKRHYTNGTPPRKPYDYQTALALRLHMRDAASLVKEQHWRARKLFYSNVYGITFVSQSDSWERMRDAFERVVDITINEGDDERTRNKKQLFRKELEELRKIENLGSIPVRDLVFKLHPQTFVMTVGSS